MFQWLLLCFVWEKFERKLLIPSSLFAFCVFFSLFFLLDWRNFVRKSQSFLFSLFQFAFSLSLWRNFLIFLCSLSLLFWRNFSKGKNSFFSHLQIRLKTLSTRCGIKWMSLKMVLSVSRNGQVSSILPAIG